LYHKIIAFSFLLLFSPIYIFIVLIIIIFDGPPIFFLQKRIGKNNILFDLFKFRTMKNNVGDIPTHLITNPSSLMSKTGPLLRKYSLDELPQIINIIKGDMVFVGPRPALYNQIDLRDMRAEIGVHILKPGVTGWAQVNGRDELTILDKVKLDKYYLDNKSFLLDLKIIIISIIQVFKPKGILH